MGSLTGPFSQWSFLKSAGSFFRRCQIEKRIPWQPECLWGGYGAWKLGLGASETFGAAAALSGVLDVSRRLKEKTANPVQKPSGFWEGIFGDPDGIEGSFNDLKYLARRLKEERKPVPRLFSWCGEEDFLYQNNIDMWQEMKSLGYIVETRSGKGNHQWKYWDQEIQTILKWWLE